MDKILSVLLEDVNKAKNIDKEFLTQSSYEGKSPNHNTPDKAVPVKKIIIIDDKAKYESSLTNNYKQSAENT